MKRRSFIHSAARTGVGLGVAGSLLSTDLLTHWWQRREQAGPDRDALRRAQEGIKSHRMADMAVQIFGPDGLPLADSAVTVQQTDRPFLTGFSVLKQPGYEHIDRFFHDMNQLCNAATMMCYWDEQRWTSITAVEREEGKRVYSAFDDTLAVAEQLDLLPKGHPVYWPVEKAIPRWTRKYPLEKQWALAEQHVRALVGRYRGRVKLWDLVNEALWEPTLANLPQRHWPHLEPVDDIAAYIAQVMRWAREEDPAAQYILNDYGLQSDLRPGGVRTKDGVAVTAAMQRRRYVALARALRERGYTPDGLGLQCHTGENPTASELWQLFEEIGEANLPIHITEYWSRLSDFGLAGSKRFVPDDGHWKEEVIPEGEGISVREAKALRTQYVQDCLTLAFGHPQVEAFSFWGKKTMYLGDLLHKSDAYYAVDELLNHTWKTRLEARTDAEGRVQFRGFKGTYRLYEPEQRRVASGIDLASTSRAEVRLSR